MTELKVAVMVYGAENLSKQLNEWKTFVEANSKFKLKITEIHEPELTEITRWTSYDEPCHLATRENVNYDAIPKTNQVIMLFWKLLEGQKTCLGGGTWGGDWGIHGKPYTTIPYNVWWWDESYTHEGFNTHGAQIITHEFQNALRWLLEHEYGWKCPVDPYAGDCDGMTLAECYKAIFSAIPQSVYDKIEEVGQQTKFVVDGDTVEVHPYILVTPLGKNPVFAAIENIGEVPVAVDIWEVFGGITIPAQTTPVIEPHTEITYKYEFITPDLPKGTYPCTFYIGKFGELVDDKFTQQAIRITDVIIGIDYGFYDIKTPEVVTQNQKAEITIPMKIDWIKGAESAVLDVWTIRDKDKFYAELFSEDVTIVDDKVLEIMRKYTIGITHTKTITKGIALNHIHEFTIPPDLPLGKHTFCVFFGKYDDYFLGAAGFSGHSFDATVLPKEPTTKAVIFKSIPPDAGVTITKL